MKTMVRRLHIKPFRQTRGFCGPASLRMVLSYYGMEQSERALARLSGAIRAQGVRAAGLAAAARRLGFKAQVKDRATLADVRQWVSKKRVPVIVNWFSTDEGHYSVVVGITSRTISLLDPEWGKVRTIDKRVFARVWFDFMSGMPLSGRSLVVRRLIAVYR